MDGWLRWAFEGVGGGVLVLLIGLLRRERHSHNSTYNSHDGATQQVASGAHARIVNHYQAMDEPAIRRVVDEVITERLDPLANLLRSVAPDPEPRAQTEEEAEYEREEAKYKTARAINGLPEREKIVVTLHYYEGLTFDELGQVLGVSPARVRRIHANAMRLLRAELPHVTLD